VGEQLRVAHGNPHRRGPLKCQRVWVGYEVHRAARIAASATGGQVIALFGRRRTSLKDTLPPEVSLRDLGSIALKDLGRPETISNSS